jgi:hypothetical protein
MDEVFARVRHDPLPSLLAGLPPTWPNLRDRYGRSLLHEAVHRGRPDLAIELIARGIDTNIQDRDGRTVLHAAADNQQVEVARAALARGANPRLVDGHGNSPLWTAVFHAKEVPGLARLLVQAGADPRQKNRYGKSPLDMAHSYGEFGTDVVDELLGR